MDYEIFENMLNRIVSLSVALETERQARIAAEDKASARRLDVTDVFNLIGHMATDQKIEAIKDYRALTGAGLLDSKNAIDSVMNRKSA